MALVRVRELVVDKRIFVVFMGAIFPKSAYGGTAGPPPPRPPPAHLCCHGSVTVTSNGGVKGTGLAVLSRTGLKSRCYPFDTDNTDEHGTLLLPRIMLHPLAGMRHRGMVTREGPISRLKVHVLWHRIIVCLGLIRRQRRYMSEGKQQTELYLNKTRDACQVEFCTLLGEYPPQRPACPTPKKTTETATFKGNEIG